MATEWNNENARLKVLELQELPDDQRQEQADMMRDDLKGWAQKTFSFTDRQQACMKIMPEAYYSEVGYLLGRAIEKKHPLDVWAADDSTPTEFAKRHVTVTVGWNPTTGPNISVTISN